MSKIDGSKAPEVNELAEAEVAAKQKKEQDENIKKNLSNPKFLNFLQKNPDSVENASNDEYLAEKIKIFDNVQKVKTEVKKYITVESNSGYTGIVDDSFVEGLEDMSIKNPTDFLDFSSKISKYLESVSKIKSLETYYQKAFVSLQMEGDYTKLTGEKKIEAVNAIHDKIDKTKNDAEEGLANLEQNRTFRSRFGFLSAGKKYNEDVSALNKGLAELKSNEKKLDKNSILSVLTEIEGIKNGLKSNQAFIILTAEFQKKAEEKMAEAKRAKNYGALAKNLTDLEGTNTKQSILDDDKYDAMREDIREFSKKETYSNAIDLVEKDEAVTLNFFEKGINKLREDGIKLGLTNDECNELIRPVLEAKIEDLAKNQSEGQNKIKLILATRILNNLE